MAVHDSLKSLVRQYIKTNGQNEITGQILQNVLIAMIDELGITIDPTPTKNSSDAVSSGGTFGVLQQLNEINATLSGDGKIYNNYQAGDIYYTEQNSVRVYWVALADGEASEENPVTISDLNFYHAENATDAVRMSLSTKTFNIDAYTKQESDAKYQPKGNYQPAGDYATEQQLAGKANASDVYTKSETYSKAELDNLITTPNQQYVSVTATAQTTAITDLLPATGAADTIYRVGNWDGTQYDPTMYALFAWNGTTYVCLAVRSFVGEVYDVSVNHPDGQGNPTHYADLTAALGTDGANIPADIRRGGMSIKFIQGTVQSSDNKYVQYRLMADEWSIDTMLYAICEEGVYIDSQEWIRVYTDEDNKILFGIKPDGAFYFGAGCPPQVKEYISDYGYDKNTTDGLFAGKVDKETGKSLISEGFASSQGTIDEQEWLQVSVDSKDKIIEGITINGNKYIGGKLIVGDDIKSPTIDLVKTSLLKDGILPITTGDFVEGMTISDIVSTYNSKLDTFCILSRCCIACMETLSVEDSDETLYEKINRNFRRDIVWVGMPKSLFCSQLNKYFSIPIQRFNDAKLNTTNDLNFSLRVGYGGDYILSGSGEPSALISDDGQKIELFMQCNGFSYTETSDGVHWTAKQQIVIHDFPGTQTRGHMSFNKVDGKYYLVDHTFYGDDQYFDLFESEDKINFYYKGHILKGGLSDIGTGDIINDFGNSYLFKDRDDTHYYLIYECCVEDPVYESSAYKICLMSCTDLLAAQEDGFVGNWVQCSENPIIGHDLSERIPYGNPELIHGIDNQPIKHDGNYYMTYHTYYSIGNNRYARVIRSKSPDLVHWTYDGIYYDNRDVPDGGFENADTGDISMCEFKGKSYFFYSHNINNWIGPTPVTPSLRYTIDDRPQLEMLGIRP